MQNILEPTFTDYLQGRRINMKEIKFYKFKVCNLFEIIFNSVYLMNYKQYLN